jgi:hypothetical protein
VGGGRRRQEGREEGIARREEEGEGKRGEGGPNPLQGYLI